MTGFQGRHNVYTCPKCGGSIVTIDRDEGVTPSHLACRATPGCTGTSRSAWYPAAAADLTPTWEWYRPETRRQRRQLDQVVRKHVERGGLLLRHIESGRDPLTDPAECRCHAPALLGHLPSCATGGAQ